MNEGEWLACDDLRAFPGLVWERATDRQVQLLAVACCRRIGHLLEERSRNAVEAAERFADGQATVEELYEARDDAREALDYGYRTLAPGVRKHVHTAHLRAVWDTAALCLATTQREGDRRAEFNRVHLLSIALCAGNAVAHEAYLANRKQMSVRSWDRLVRAEAAIQAALLRDVFGNPFRNPVADPVWLAWNDGTVVKVARVIYEEKQFEDVPLLADALEEAGCDNADILSHLRGPEPHVRACWVVDAILGRSRPDG